MEAFVRSLDLKARVDLALKPPRYAPFVMSRDERIVQVFDEVYREMVGSAPMYVYSAGITDANVFGERGIPCLHLGPARGDIHQPNEYVARQWLELLPRMYASLAARFLSDEG